ncbi:MAG: S8 family serine peptidase [Candidatus Zixiibacteriota bacterium]|nr:MAG: S8 family serine peptidase [candidate division Zixibacteria bacterium]
MTSILILLVFSLPLFASENRVAWEGPYITSMAKQNPVIDAKLQNRLLSSNIDRQVPVWAFFTDKGIFSRSELYSRLAELEMKLTPESSGRRLKSRGRDNLVDFRDLPVYPEYVERILSVGAELRHRLKWFNAATFNATGEQIQTISRFPFVRLVKSVAGAKSNIDLEFDSIQPDLTTVTLSYGPSFGQLGQINAIAAHELGFKGQDIIICMMDTGYRQAHQAFQNIINGGRLIAQYDFINGDTNTDYDPVQDVPNQPNHGTVTWSTLGGESEGNLYGPSYMSHFILSKSEDISSERHIEEDNWAAGAEWADSIGASVISSSLGYRWFDAGQGDYQYEDIDGNTTIVTIAADLAAYNGIAVATAMGNEGNWAGSLLAPADGDSVIGCGAVDPNGYIAGFSSFGPTYDGRIKPEVCAQGVNTVCADPNDMNGYTTSGGTSLATPLVGGSCGVLFSAHPNWTPVMVREALMMTGCNAQSPTNDYGWGIVNLARALYYHPRGDILFDHQPAVMAGSGQPVNISATVTGAINISDVYLYYRTGNSGDFTETLMNSNNGIDYKAVIPPQNGTLQYYFRATDVNAYAYDPIGGSMHPYKIDLESGIIDDSFEDGIVLWKSGGTNNCWGLTHMKVRTGDISISDSPNTYYLDNTDSWLESKFKLNLLYNYGAEVSFYYRGVIQNGVDFLYFEYSTDDGTSWDQFPNPITGSFFNFNEYTVSLSALGGQPDVRLRFHLVTNDSGQREGIIIDDFTITLGPTDVEEDTPLTPISFDLFQNYPNPFNAATRISFSLDDNKFTRLTIYDLLGRQVKTLISGELPAGIHEVIWDGTGRNGKVVSSGVYLYRLESGFKSHVKRMLLLK